MKINGESFLNILDQASDHLNYDNPPIWRTLYGNLGADGDHAQRADVKYHLDSMVPDGIDFLSTDEKTFRSTKKLIQHFEDKSPWEK